MLKPITWQIMRHLGVAFLATSQRKRNRRSPSKTTSGSANRRIKLETLERRQLLAAEIGISLNDGNLLIQGTEQSDLISVAAQGSQIRVITQTRSTEGTLGNATHHRFDATGILKVIVSGGGGDDLVAIRGAIDTEIFGGDGDDVLLGGDGDDIIDGGAGADRIMGRGGDDELIGGEDADFIHGGRGNNIVYDRQSGDRVVAAIDASLDELEWSTEDAAVKSAPSSVSVVTPSLDRGVLVIRGTSGGDTINLTLNGNFLNVAGQSFRYADIRFIVIAAEGGDDNISVGPSILKTTYIYGGHGNDTIIGGGGVDVIFGSAGNDRIWGLGGNDHIWTGSGTDGVNGGAGTNRITRGTASRTYTMNGFEQEIVRLTNVERTSRGLPPLASNTRLAAAANLHAVQMAAESALIGNQAAHSHALWGVRYPTMTTRLDYAGYEFSSARENIAFGFTSPASIVSAWMNSPGHRTNILASDITNIGVSVARNANGTLFFSQNFGRPF